MHLTRRTGYKQEQITWVRSWVEIIGKWGAARDQRKQVAGIALTRTGYS